MLWLEHSSYSDAYRGNFPFMSFRNLQYNNQTLDCHSMTNFKETFFRLLAEYKNRQSSKCQVGWQKPEFLTGPVFCKFHDINVRDGSRNISGAQSQQKNDYKKKFQSKIQISQNLKITYKSDWGLSAFRLLLYPPLLCKLPCYVNVEKGGLTAWSSKVQDTRKSHLQTSNFKLQHSKKAVIK